MDGIPLPHNAIRTHPRIPYVCTAEYDRGDFLSYPIRTGWSTEEINRTVTWENLDQEGYRTSNEARSFLQSWMFFGILDVIFGSLVSFDDFIDVDPSGVKFVHTRNLAEVAQKASDGPPRDERFVRKCVVSTYSVQKVITTSKSLGSDFVVSLGLFLHTIPQFYPSLRQMGLNTASFWPLVPAQPQTEIFANDQRAVSYFSSELMLHGWCPHLVDRLQTNEMCFQYMCVFLEPPHSDKDHSRCTPKKCVAFHIQKSTYSHQHVSEDCECDMIRVDMEAVCSILNDGRIPVVDVSASETDGTARSTLRYLTVKNTEEISHRYVAISHVWSDGLGNPTENSIASCQIRRICRVVSQLPGSDGGPVHVWIDTLCCPVQPKKMRHLAIIRMRQTYQEASSVLVLDKSLQNLSHRDMGLMEIVAHIFSSAWMTRLWTWQEGALPKECYIQFFDGALNFEDLLDRAMEASQSVHDLSYFTLREVAMLYWGVRGRPNTRGPSATARFELSQITSALDGRSTSMLEDEATCIGAMMNSDLSKILAFDGARDRMRAFWQTCPSIPREVLFWTLTRLPDPGFRWAPDTFLNVGGGSQLDRADIEHTAVLKPAGLQAQLPGLLFQGELDHPVNADFWISDSSGHWSWHVMGNPEMPGGVFGHPTADDVAPHYNQLAMLVDRKVDAESARRSTPVTLIYVYAKGDGVVYARRSDTAFMFWEDHPGAQRRPVMDRLKRTLNDPENTAVERQGMNVLLSGRYHVLEGHWVGEDQQWCID